jgi:hypothetical protein
LARTATFDSDDDSESVGGVPSPRNWTWTKTFPTTALISSRVIVEVPSEGHEMVAWYSNPDAPETFWGTDWAGTGPMDDPTKLKVQGTWLLAPAMACWAQPSQAGWKQVWA